MIEDERKKRVSERKTKRGKTKARNLPFLALVLLCCLTLARALLFSLVPILVPIALFASRSLWDVGTRIEGLCLKTMKP